MESGIFHEEDMENADETHFVFNMYNGKTPSIRCKNQVKYADVVSSGENITMTVRISGGPNATVQASLTRFRNKER